jgi:hypothetical protein
VPVQTELAVIGFVRRRAGRDRAAVSISSRRTPICLFRLPQVLSFLSYRSRTVPFNSPVFVKSTAAFEALNNTEVSFPVD